MAEVVEVLWDEADSEGEEDEDGRLAVEWNAPHAREVCGVARVQIRVVARVKRAGDDVADRDPEWCTLRVRVRMSVYVSV